MVVFQDDSSTTAKAGERITASRVLVLGPTYLHALAFLWVLPEKDDQHPSFPFLRVIDRQVISKAARRVRIDYA
jgi:hypothetical protein